MSLRVVEAVRYITSLREGGSLPALVETAGGGRFVVKLRGAGQGPLALVAEVVVGEMARTLGLRVPEIALVELDPAFARTEPDPEIQDLFRASRELNAGLAFLPGATVFDPACGDTVDALTASLTVWLDAFTLNVDRTPRNANLLCWHGAMWLIDHGAAMYFHHHWPGAAEKVASPFVAIREHILLPFASAIEPAGEVARARLNAAEIERILEMVPAAWMVHAHDTVTAEERREQYLRFFTERLAQAAVFEEEIRRARAQSV